MEGDSKKSVMELAAIKRELRRKERKLRKMNRAVKAKKHVRETLERHNCTREKLNTASDEETSDLPNSEKLSNSRMVSFSAEAPEVIFVTPTPQLRSKRKELADKHKFLSSDSSSLPERHESFRQTSREKHESTGLTKSLTGGDVSSTCKSSPFCLNIREKQLPGKSVTKSCTVEVILPKESSPSIDGLKQNSIEKSETISAVGTYEHEVERKAQQAFVSSRTVNIVDTAEVIQKEVDCAIMSQISRQMLSKQRNQNTLREGQSQDLFGTLSYGQVLSKQRNQNTRREEQSQDLFGTYFYGQKLSKERNWSTFRDEQSQDLFATRSKPEAEVEIKRMVMSESQQRHHRMSQSTSSGEGSNEMSPQISSSYTKCKEMRHEKQIDGMSSVSEIYQDNRMNQIDNENVNEEFLEKYVEKETIGMNPQKKADENCSTNENLQVMEMNCSDTIVSAVKPQPIWRDILNSLNCGSEISCEEESHMNINPLAEKDVLITSLKTPLKDNLCCVSFEQVCGEKKYGKILTTGFVSCIDTTKSGSSNSVLCPYALIVQEEGLVLMGKHGSDPRWKVAGEVMHPVADSLHLRSITVIGLKSSVKARFLIVLSTNTTRDSSQITYVHFRLQKKKWVITKSVMCSSIWNCQGNPSCCAVGDWSFALHLAHQDSPTSLLVVDFDIRYYCHAKEWDLVCQPHAQAISSNECLTYLTPLNNPDPSNILLCAARNGCLCLVDISDGITLMEFQKQELIPFWASAQEDLVFILSQDTDSRHLSLTATNPMTGDQEEFFSWKQDTSRRSECSPSEDTAMKKCERREPTGVSLQPQALSILFSDGVFMNIFFPASPEKVAKHKGFRKNKKQRLQ